MSTGYINLPVEGGGGGASAWGSITGTLSDQTDLQAALNAKDTIYNWQINPDRQLVFFTDFNDASLGGLLAASNAGGGSGLLVTNDSTYGANTTENVFGAVAAVTGSGTTARVALYGGGSFVIGLGKIRLGVRLAMDNLSAANPTYTAYFGVGDAPTAGDNSDGVYFRYTHSVNSGKWEAVVAKDGVRAPADTGVAPAATVFQVLEIEINDAGTEAQFYIDGALTNTISSGLPGAGDFMRYYWKVEKSAGAASLQQVADWFYIKTTRTAAR